MKRRDFLNQKIQCTGFRPISSGKNTEKAFYVSLASLVMLLFIFSPPWSSAQDTPRGPRIRGEFEASLVLLTGNSNSQSNFIKGGLVQTLGQSRYTFKGDFARSETDDIETAKRWSFSTRYDRLFRGFGSAFISENFQSNRFAGFSHRFNSDLGASWNAYESSRFDLVTEGGYRNTRERETESDDFETENKGRLKLESTLKTKAFRFMLWVEYLPNFTNQENWQSNSELSVRYVLNEIISLKTSYLVLYDNEPNEPGLEKTDTTLATSLVAGF